MAFVGITTPPMAKYLSTSSTSTDWVSPIATASAPSDYLRTTRVNSENGNTEDTRCRGFAFYPFCDHGSVNAEGKTFGFQIVAWRKATQPTSPYNLVEYRPLVLWRGTATLGGANNLGASGGYGTTLRLAKTIVETSGYGIPPALAGLPGLTALLFNYSTNTFGDACVIIPDLSHLFDGVTLSFVVGTGGDAAGNANVLFQSIC